MSDLRKRLESILFASGKKLSVEDLSKLTRERDFERITVELIELKKELEEKESSIMLVQEGDTWKLTVREKYLPFVRKIVTQTELPKSVIETLAVISFKAPVLQSLVIKIRTNKAYRHLDILEEMGYISRVKQGRTKLIKLTQKFFEYFDLPPEKLKEKFSGFKELDKVISAKEKELEKEEAKRMQPKDSKKLKTYDTLQQAEGEVLKLAGVIETQKVGEMEVYYDLKKKKERKKERYKNRKKARKEKKKHKKETKGKQKETKKEKEIEKTKEKITEKGRITVDQIKKEAKKRKTKSREGNGLYPEGMPPEVEKRVDERVEEIVTGKKKEEKTPEKK